MKISALYVVFVLLLGGCGGGSKTDGGGSADPLSVGGTGTSALYSGLRSGGKLILHQRGSLAVTPARVAAADATLDAFDGAFVRLPVATDAVMKNAPIDQATIAADLAPLAAVLPTHMRYNFALVTAQHDLDAFADWSVVLRNFTNLARAARDAGFVGIAIDNESPAGLRVAFPGDVADAAQGLAAYRVQTQAVGRRIMQALVTEFPDIAVVVLRGPAAAEAQTPPQLVVRDVGSAQLLGSFFAGFVEGKGARSLVVDGGSDYGLRIDDQFADSRAWRKTGIASDLTNSPFVPSALRASWSTATSVAFGVREIDGARADRLPNRIPVWENTIAAALRHADSLVWASFDVTDLTQASTTDPWVVASRRAKAAGTNANARLGSLTDASGTGLIAQYFAQPDQTDLAETTVDPLIDYEWTAAGPTTTTHFPQQANYAVVWSGYVEAPVSGTYTIYATTDDGMRVTIGGLAVIDKFFDQGPTEYAEGVELQAGFRYAIKVEYFQHGGNARATIEWEPPGLPREPIPQSRLYPVL